ncbi:MAG: hypothetical protein EBT92_02925 [Planctomycetes bacterium]|nr:hypothetical protein [Planctomycetota bacterium]
MHCYGCNTSVNKDQERCSSCGFPLKIVLGKCENFSDVGVEYQNEWLKYREEITANASNKSLLPLIGIYFGFRCILLSNEGSKKARLVKKNELANRFVHIRRLGIFGLITNFIAFIFIVIGIISFFRSP